MRMEFHRAPGFDEYTSNRSDWKWSELQANKKCESAGLCGELSESSGIADFCTTVMASLNPDEVLNTAARKLYDYLNYRLLVLPDHPELYDNAVMFYPDCACRVVNGENRVGADFPGIRAENVRGFETLGLSSPQCSGTAGHVICRELPLNMGFMKIVAYGDSSEIPSSSFLERILESLAIALKNAHEYERVREDSLRDSLTGLYNRRVLEEMLDMEDRKRGVNPLSLLLIDLDDFKGINDTYGHPCGDMALKITAGVLRDNARGSDLVVRNGGEEFAIMLPSTSASTGLEVGERLRRSIEKIEILHEGIRVRLTASVGIAHRTCKEQVPAKEMMAQADQALYQAKKTGKNRVCFYSSSPVLVGRN